MTITTDRPDLRGVNIPTHFTCDHGHPLDLGVVEAPEGIYLASDCPHCEKIVERLTPSYPSVDSAVDVYWATPVRRLFDHLAPAELDRQLRRLAPAACGVRS